MLRKSAPTRQPYGQCRADTGRASRRTQTSAPAGRNAAEPAPHTTRTCKVHREVAAPPAIGVTCNGCGANATDSSAAQPQRDRHGVQLAARRGLACKCCRPNAGPHCAQFGAGKGKEDEEKTRGLEGDCRDPELSQNLEDRRWREVLSSGEMRGAGNSGIGETGKPTDGMTGGICSGLELVDRR
ncbi:hypothetical protein B0H19DRAFT_1058544 [Mycena capillaripes]|nr:hypothetical protein B0H19DRAFT_1058544 [Mycena capillaripes]